MRRRKNRSNESFTPYVLRHLQNIIDDPLKVLNRLRNKDLKYNIRVRHSQIKEAFQTDEAPFCQHFVAPINAPDQFSAIVRDVTGASKDCEIVLSSLPYVCFTVSWSIRESRNLTVNFLALVQRVPINYEQQLYDDSEFTVVIFGGQLDRFIMFPYTFECALNSSAIRGTYIDELDQSKFDKYQVPPVETQKQACNDLLAILHYLDLHNEHSQDEPLLVDGYKPPLTKRDKRKGKLPAVEHKIISIVKPKVVPVTLPGTGTSGYKQREHTRRGHTRILRSGRKVEVRPCVAGDARLGRIEKDYDLEPS